MTKTHSFYLFKCRQLVILDYLPSALLWDCIIRLSHLYWCSWKSHASLSFSRLSSNLRTNLGHVTSIGSIFWHHGLGKMSSRHIRHLNFTGVLIHALTSWIWHLGHSIKIKSSSLENIIFPFRKLHFFIKVWYFEKFAGHSWYQKILWPKNLI